SERRSIDIERAAQRPQRFQFRGEGEGAVDMSPVERLYAEAVPPERQLAAFAIPHREGKHALALAQGFLYSPMRKALKQHLRVGAAAQGDTRLPKLLSEVAIVVDFAVEGDDEAAVRRHHRLVARGADIDDREAAMTEGDAGIGIAP